MMAGPCPHCASERTELRRLTCANGALHADPSRNPLAGLRADQRRVYQKLRNCGVPKAAAIAEAERA